MALTVRFAGPKDIPGLTALDKKKPRRSVLTDSPTKVVIALDKNKVVGKALLHVVPWLNGKKRAILADIFVAKNYRHEGIGTKLVDFCVKEARKVADDIQIDRVDPTNKFALRIYKKKFPKKQLVYGSW